MKTQKEDWRKKTGEKKYKNATFDVKLLVVDQIQNDQISTYYASKKHGYEVH